MKLLLVIVVIEIAFRNSTATQGNSGNTTQRHKHHTLHTMFVVTLHVGNYTMVQEACNPWSYTLGYRFS